ncbi:MAG: hypothetical protein WDN28_03385 [Chthoniobacter sp.]
MLFDTYHHFTPQDFIFRIAQTAEALDGYWALRRAIFCEEQQIFQGTDRDEFDARAMPIVCETLIAAWKTRSWAWCGSMSANRGCGTVRGWGWRWIFAV